MSERPHLPAAMCSCDWAEAFASSALEATEEGRSRAPDTRGRSAQRCLAQTTLGLMCHEGEGVRQAPVQAHALLNIAANQDLNLPYLDGKLAQIHEDLERELAPLQRQEARDLADVIEAEVIR